ncbi:radical SAM protein [Methanocaldococcus indicus]|uniref:radical SAM protein n=1 Tax=Methanocaldococcus indicus TaxID=213231 RepID=UPI003C6D5ABA
MIVLRSETSKILEKLVKELKYVKHCYGCEGITEKDNPYHHPSIELTQSCNLNCLFCYSKLKKVKRGIYGNLEECEAVTISQYGEPLLKYEDVKKAVQYVKDLGLRVDLQTNGILLDEDKILELKDLGVDIVMISLPGIDTYKKLCGKDIVNRVIENIQLANKHFHTIVRTIYIPGVNENDLLNIAKLDVDEILVHHLIIYDKKIINSLNIDKSKIGSLRDLLLTVYKMREINKKTNITIKGCLLKNIKEFDSFLLENINLDVFSEVPDIKREYKKLPWEE